MARPADRESLAITESARLNFFNDPIVHWYRNIFSHVPATKVREIAAMLKAIHASEREKAMCENPVPQEIAVVHQYFQYTGKR